MAIVALVIFVLADITLSAIAAPTHSGPLSMSLDQVMNNSVCPIKIDIDENVNRIPRRIKMLKCASTPNPMCDAENMTHACCRSRHHHFNTQCVEVTDSVLVRYTDREDNSKLEQLTVSVGCSCMIRKETPAVEDH